MGLPVITGPSQFNFQTICEQLGEQGALLKVADEYALAEAVVSLLKDPARRLQMGEAGRQSVAANRGALDRIYTLVAAHLPVIGSD
jgi:3-deoxy-D-manno-octulosonic-acid transferase